jgi:membrane protein YdbS with pleckstrin-like domain
VNGAPSGVVEILDAGRRGDRPPERVLWRGRPSPWFAPREYLTNRYKLTNERLMIEHGLFGRRTEEIDLFRVVDVAVSQSALARVAGHGDVRIMATDRSAPRKRLLSVRDPDGVKDLIRDAARREREARHVLLRNEV